MKTFDEIYKDTDSLDDKALLDSLREESRCKLASEKFLHQFGDLFAAVEHNNVRVSDVVTSVTIWTDLRKNYPEYVDPETELSVLKDGRMGGLWGANVWVDKTVPPNHIRVYGEDDPAFASEWPKFASAAEKLWT
jgi:hypothetical protein